MKFKVGIYSYRILFRRSFFIFFILFFCYLNLVAQSKKDKERIDSIFTAISKMPEDTQTVNYIYFIATDYLWQFSLPETYSKLKYSVKLSRKLGYNRGEYSAYVAMASYCDRAGAVDFALQNDTKALEVAKRMNDSTKINTAWLGIGLCYQSMGKHDSALFYLSRSRKAIEHSGNKDKIARLYLFLCWTYQSLQQDSLALEYGNRSLELRRELNYVEGMMSSMGSLIGTYTKLKEYDKAYVLCKEAYEIQLKNNNQFGIANSFYGIGSIQEKRNLIDTALTCYLNGLKISTAINDKILMRDGFQHVAEALEKKGNPLRAYSYYKKFVHLKDSLQNQELKVKEVRTKEIYDLESKNAQIDLLSKEKELSIQENDAKKKKLLWLTFTLAITFTLVIVIFVGYRRKQKLAKDLQQQKKIIEEKNKDITDSINYAQRIQKALLASDDLLNKNLREHFVFFKPKDIVSGDFYWATENDGRFYLAVCDSTGHGVPGAFMSLLNISFLNEAIAEKGIIQPNEIFNHVRQQLISTISQEGAKDGMDGILLSCKMENGRRQMEYSAANNAPILIQDGEIIELDEDKMPVGAGDKKDSFTHYSLPSSIHHQPSTIYLYTDGFADQFGGPKGKKFKYKPLNEKLLAISEKPLAEQKEILEKTFNDWKGNLEQVDDVLIIGVKL